MIDRSDLTICKDPSEPEIPYKLDVCEIRAVFYDPADRLVSVGFCNTSTTDPNGFYQHTFGGDTPPGCPLVVAIPTLECDSFVTLGRECDTGGSATDPDFDSTGFNNSGEVTGGWYNSVPSNGQGVPDANGRVLSARFSYKHNKNTTGSACVFVTQGAGQIVEFPMQPFDCAVPGMQAGGGGGAPPGGGGGANQCVDVPLEDGTWEPAIAVNPLDPSNIAVAGNPDPPDLVPLVLTVSTDGGKTWCQEGSPCSAPLPAECPEPIAFIGDPTLAFDSSGQLYWCYLCALQNPNFGGYSYDMFVLQVDPVTGAAIGDPVQVMNNLNLNADKEWFAIGPQPDGTGDRLYLVWYNREFISPGVSDGYIAFSYTDDISTGWTTPVALSPPIDSFGVAMLSHVAASPITASPLTGDVFVAYHSQPGYSFYEGNPDGETGEVVFRRSRDGGVTWNDPNPPITPYEAGEADITWNFQDVPGSVPQTNFCAAGSSQPWILPDPLDSNRIYLIAADDPDNIHGDPDDFRVFIVASSDAGLTWDALGPGPKRIEPDAPDDTFQVFPTAAIDPITGDLAVLWYDNRIGTTFGEPPSFFLDVFFSISTDQGVTFSEPRQINDQPFNDTLGALPECLTHVDTTRIGEYIGVALTTDTATGKQLLHSAWTGNSADDQQIIFGTAVVQLEDCPGDLNHDGEVGPFDLASLLANWGLNPCGSPDFNGDGDVGPFDLATLLAAWGPCP